MFDRHLKVNLKLGKGYIFPRKCNTRRKYYKNNKRLTYIDFRPQKQDTGIWRKLRLKKNTYSSNSETRKLHSTQSRESLNEHINRLRIVSKLRVNITHVSDPSNPITPRRCYFREEKTVHLHRVESQLSRRGTSC